VPLGGKYLGEGGGQVGCGSCDSHLKLSVSELTVTVNFR
jgi:hypothetical protein